MLKNSFYFQCFQRLASFCFRFCFRHLYLQFMFSKIEQKVPNSYSGINDMHFKEELDPQNIYFDILHVQKYQLVPEL